MLLMGPVTIVADTIISCRRDKGMVDEPSAITNMRAVTLSREYGSGGGEIATRLAHRLAWQLIDHEVVVRVAQTLHVSEEDRKSTRLNSSHANISYAVFCLKKKNDGNPFMLQV